MKTFPGPLNAVLHLKHTCLNVALDPHYIGILIVETRLPAYTHFFFFFFAPWLISKSQNTQEPKTKHFEPAKNRTERGEHGSCTLTPGPLGLHKITQKYARFPCISDTLRRLEKAC